MNGLPPSPQQPRRTRLVQGIVLLFGLAVAGLVLIPVYRVSREQPRDEACAANMEMLARVIAEYNLDHPQARIDSMADAGDVFSPHSVLLKEAYLKGQVSRPLPSCDYLGTGLASGGRIHCPVHGTSEEVRGRIANHPLAVRYLRPLVRWLLGVR
ncbi:MAG: hypothetical protein GX442_03870 [Candidatus Riflebacteria bacterium]|nr:hypothetical protein [Candidatus Riflebacteria bacterium]